MALHKSDNYRGVQGNLQVLALWLVLPALAVGTASSPGGLACAGKSDKPAGREQASEAHADRQDENGSRRDPNQPVHSHPAFAQRVQERERMVSRQIEAREVSDPNVLRAMRTVPRHAFVPEAQRTYAYEDRPLYIGHGQTISQPYIVAFMTEALTLDPNSVVLEIGTGSGYQAAVCAEIAREVYTIEIVEPLAKSAEDVLHNLGYRNVHVRAGDGYFGWPEKSPFDAIIGTAAAREVPPLLIEQLKRGGRMILPVHGEHGFQHLVLLTKDERGQLERREVMPVLFVPMTGRIQESQ